MIKEKLRNKITRFAMSHKVTRETYYKIFNWKLKKHYERLFQRRLNSIDPSNVLDLSHRPDINVVLVIVDCLRFRNLSFTGYDRETTPFMDSLKLKFRAISAAPWTYPSLGSLMTGLYPSVHGADFGIEERYLKYEKYRYLKPLKKNVLTLPEILYFYGYDVIYLPTIYWAVHVLRGRVVPRKYLGKLPAEKVLENYAKILKKTKEPFFAYIHLGDLHIPIKIPKSFKNFFGKVKKLKNINWWDYTDYKDQKGEKFREYRENRMLLYDNALRYVDYSLEKFHNFLNREGLLDNTIFIVTSDHGEGFWEHAEEGAKFFYIPGRHHGIDHGENLFNEFVEVPILMDGESVSKGNNADYYVSTVDIFPTLMKLLGINTELPTNGINLLNRPNRKRFILSEAVGFGYEKKALYVGKIKLLYAPKDKIKWIYDLNSDPFEKNPITDDKIVRKFERILIRYMVKIKTVYTKMLLKLKMLNMKRNKFEVKARKILT